MNRKIKTITTLALALVLGMGIFGESVVKAKKAKDAATVTGKAMKITKKSRVSEDEMTGEYKDFSLRALKEAVSLEEEGKNIMISPASLMFALDMAAMGAKGKTYSQIASLYNKNATKKDLMTFAKNYRKTLEDSGMIDIANSIWINENNLTQNNIKVNEEYLNLLRKHFKAAAASRKFSEAVKDEINAWISKKTKGMIPQTLDKLSQKTLMLIINAMAFEGKWKEEYQDYQINENGKFTNYAGETETAKMLLSEENLYFETSSEKGFLKYYEGNKYAFLAILPKDSGISVNEYVAGLSDEAFTNIMNSIYSTEVDTVTPAFTFDYSIVMNDMLKNLGMKKAFNASADFSLLLSADSRDAGFPVYIGSVIQKTHIELDEKGTKAAAVTVIDVEDGACPEPDFEERKEVILNRPFVFAIMDMEKQTPVFEGVVNTLES